MKGYVFLLVLLLPLYVVWGLAVILDVLGFPKEYVLTFLLALPIYCGVWAYGSWKKYVDVESVEYGPKEFQFLSRMYLLFFFSLITYAFVSGFTRTLVDGIDVFIIGVCHGIGALYLEYNANLVKKAKEG